MTETVDYYDVERMIRDARSAIRGEIDAAVREACRQLRAEYTEAVRELREQVAEHAISGGTVA